MKAFVLILSIALSGCSTIERKFENRAVCTMDGKEAHVISKWGVFSIGSKLADADAKVICK